MATEGSEAQGPIQVIRLGEDRHQCAPRSPATALWLAPWAEEKSKEGVKFLGPGLPHGMGLCLWGSHGAGQTSLHTTFIPPTGLP